ncbi:MAG: hypothetical protein AB7I04_06495 [Pseudomonadales bacterium]
MSRVRGVARWLSVVAGLLMAAGAWGDDYSDAWGPAVGSRLPVLAAPDQTGAMRGLADLAGERGLLLFLSRSADW